MNRIDWDRIDRGCVRGRARGLLASAVALACLGLGRPGAGLAEGSPARVVIAVETGRLTPGEVSPRSGEGERWARSVVEEGWAVPSVATPPAESRSLAALRSLILDEATLAALAATTVRTLEVDLADRDALRAFLAPPPRPWLVRLEALFGNPSEANDEELAAVRALSDALGRDPPATPARAGGSSEAASARGLTARIGDVGTARLSLVRIAALGDSPEEVRERDEVLSRLDASAGAEGFLVVGCFPERGDGSILLRGPGLDGGWVFARRKPFDLLEKIAQELIGRLIGRLLGTRPGEAEGAKDAGASPAGGGGLKEAIRAILE